MKYKHVERERVYDCESVRDRKNEERRERGERSG